MATTLNRKKSFGQVYGHSQIGYEQDGLQFRHDGTLHSPEPSEPEKISDPGFPPVQTVESLPTAAQLADSKNAPETPRVPDPARSEAARRIWAERRAREAEASRTSDAAP